VRRHLLALDEVLAQLALHSGATVDVLSQNLDERWAVERGLQLCVQNVIDLATHLVAGAGRDVPDYASGIDQLGQLGIISVELAQELRPLAGFRNALVHGYLSVDVAIVHDVLTRHLGQVREFALAIDKYVRAPSSAP
jgi:uncharacterized protein YutE (UPF0331/DUF86 family)